MSQAIAVANQKGGVGKTTTVASLGAALAERGRRVLAVDLDPQASLTLALGFNPDSCQRTIWDVLMSQSGEDRADAFRSTVVPTNAGFTLLPANSGMDQADALLLGEPRGQFQLRDALYEGRSDFDYVLIDCPPTLGTLTSNALVASDRVLIPLQADYLALRGVDRLLSAIDLVRAQDNRALQIAGMLFTLADARLLHTQEIMEAARDAFATRVPIFSQPIRLSVRLKEAPVVGQTVLQYAPKSSAAAAYRSLAREIEEGISPLG